MSKDKASRDYPLVTVGLLCFNTGKFVVEALESVFASGYPNLQIVCIDDASSDNSVALLKMARNRFDFELHVNQTNLGVVGACNKALALSDGKYLLFVSDDLILPNRIMEDVQILEQNSQVALVCSEVELIDETSKRIGQLPFGERLPEGPFVEDLRKVWEQGSSIITPTVTYRSSTLRDLGGWNPSYEIEDRPMWIRLASEGTVGWHRNTLTTLYRRHGSNLGSKFRPRAAAEELRLAREYSIPVPLLMRLRKVLGEIHFSILFGSASFISARQALRHAGLGFLVWTLDSKAFRTWFGNRARKVHPELSRNRFIRYMDGR